MPEPAFPFPEEESYTVDRDVEEIARLHGLHIREFLGKTILNLGSGSGNLQADLDAQGIDATVISIDVNAKALQEASRRQKNNRLLLADVSALPLRDESIDLAIATYSLPMWARNTDQLISFFDECKRVVKIGGKIAVYPMEINVEEHYHDPKSSEDWHALHFINKVEADELRRSPDWEPINRSKKSILYRRAGNTARMSYPGM